MLWLENKYIGLLSNRLQQFKRKKQDSYNFRCPVCGDSKTNKFKARGWVYPKEGKLLFHCFNCDVTLSLPKLIKTVDPTLFDEFTREKIMAEVEGKEKDPLTVFVEKMKTPKFIATSPLKTVAKISQLNHDHPAKSYIVSRKIPNFYHSQLFFAPKFKEWVNTIIPEKFDLAKSKEESRIIIPFIDENKHLFGFQGRSLNPTDKVRYITIMIDDCPKAYGLNNVDRSNRIYITEGPIDSMFLKNGIAMAGGDFANDLNRLAIDKQLSTIVYDNEPRNKDTIKRIEKSIDHGYSVCIWPDHLEYKDINEMILAGMTQHDIMNVIDTNTHKDLEAKLRLSFWKKV
jgi:transcription elongation factor Elf1